MRIKLDRPSHVAIIYRDAGDKRIATESALWVAIKRRLQSVKMDVIKKEMVKDDHMVSQGQYYVRSRNMSAPGAIAIWDDSYAVRDAAKDFREYGKVYLRLEWEREPRGGAMIENIG